MNVCVTKLRCEKGELKIKLNVFTNKIRDLKMISSPVLRSLSNLMFINEGMRIGVIRYNHIP